MTWPSLEKANLLMLASSESDVPYRAQGFADVSRGDEVAAPPAWDGEIIWMDPEIDGLTLNNEKNTISNHGRFEKKDLHGRVETVDLPIHIRAFAAYLLPKDRAYTVKFKFSLINENVQWFGAFSAGVIKLGKGLPMQNKVIMTTGNRAGGKIISEGIIGEGEEEAGVKWRITTPGEEGDHLRPSFSSTMNPETSAKKIGEVLTIDDTVSMTWYPQSGLIKWWQNDVLVCEYRAEGTQNYMYGVAVTPPKCSNITISGEYTPSDQGEGRINEL